MQMEIDWIQSPRHSRTMPRANRLLLLYNNFQIILHWHFNNDMAAHAQQLHYCALVDYISTQMRLTQQTLWWMGLQKTKTKKKHFTVIAFVCVCVCVCTHTSLRSLPVPCSICSSKFTVRFLRFHIMAHTLWQLIDCM